MTFLSHTEKSNVVIRTVMRLNNYPLLLQIRYYMFYICFKELEFKHQERYFDEIG